MTAIKTFFSGESWQKFREIKRPGHATLGGVCEALGEGTPLAAWMWRALFCVAALLWGAGIVAYFILWVSIPENEG